MATSELDQTAAVNVRHLMTSLNINAHQLADLSGIPYTTIHGFLRGSRSLTIPKLHRIAVELGTTASDLLIEQAA